MYSKPKHKSGAQKRKDMRKCISVRHVWGPKQYLHRGQSQPCYATGGSSLDRAGLSVSLFRKVQPSPCQCHHVFTTEGNPTAELFICVLIKCHQPISVCRSASLTLSFSSFTSPYLLLPFLFSWDHKHVFAAHTEPTCVVQPPTCVFLIKSNGLYRILRVTFSLTLLGVVDDGMAIVVISLSKRQSRRSEVPRSCFRCHGLKDSA